MLISYVASEFTYGVSSRVALDFGVGLFSLLVVGISIFMGSGLISKEIEGRTVYMALSRSVGRFSFLTGKIVGLAMVLAVIICMLAPMTYSVYFLLGGKFETMMVWVALFSFLEGFILLNIVVFFSLITNTVLSIFYTMIIFILGHAIPGTLELSFAKNYQWVEFFIHLYSYIFPNLTLINYKDHLIYVTGVEILTLTQSFFYATIYAFVVLVMSGLIFKHRELY